MFSTKSLIILVITIHVIVASKSREDLDRERKKELRQAVDGAAAQLQTNLLATLSGLAQSTFAHAQNATRSLHILTRAVLANTFDLASVVTYMPRLLLLDFPTQFVEVLRIMRNQQVRNPATGVVTGVTGANTLISSNPLISTNVLGQAIYTSDVNASIDNVVILVRQSQLNGVQDNLFGPITRFLPNLLAGVNDFLVSIFDNVFSLLAGV